MLILNPAGLQIQQNWWYDNRHGGAKLADTLPPAPSNLRGELLNLEGEQLLSQSVNSCGFLFTDLPTSMFFCTFVPQCRQLMMAAEIMKYSSLF